MQNGNFIETDVSVHIFVLYFESVSEFFSRGMECLFYIMHILDNARGFYSFLNSLHPPYAYDIPSEGFKPSYVLYILVLPLFDLFFHDWNVFESIYFTILKFKRFSNTFFSGFCGEKCGLSKRI